MNSPIPSRAGTPGILPETTPALRRRGLFERNAAWKITCEVLESGGLKLELDRAARAWLWVSQSYANDTDATLITSLAERAVTTIKVFWDGTGESDLMTAFAREAVTGPKACWSGNSLNIKLGEATWCDAGTGDPIEGLILDGCYTFERNTV